MLEHLLRSCLEDRRKRWVVISLSLGLGLAMALPFADQYLALRNEAERLQGELQDVEQTAGRLESLEQTMERRRTELAALESGCIPTERMAVFRGEVVDLARQTGCQVRRIAVGEARQRPWRQGDNPLAIDAPPAADRQNERYQLRWQPLSVAVTGRLAGVREFLGRLAKFNALVHANQLTLQAAPGSESETLLELECLVFDLAEEKLPH